MLDGLNDGLLEGLLDGIIDGLKKVKGKPEKWPSEIKDE